MRAARNQPDSSWSGDWKVVGKLIPYLLEFPARVAAAMAFLVLAKVANVVVPLVLKYLVDGLSEDTAQLVAVPVSLVLAYGILRFSTTLFGELRDAVFSRVAERGMRRIGLEVFTHMHNLDLGFHLSRKTGSLPGYRARHQRNLVFVALYAVQYFADPV